MKMINNVNAPSKSSSWDSKKPLEREDFLLELAKESDSPHEVRHGSDPAHGSIQSAPPSQRTVTTPTASAASTPVVVADHLIPLQAAAVSLPLQKVITTPTTSLAPTTVVATVTLPFVPIVDKQGLPATIPATPTVMPAQAESLAQMQESGSQAWLSTQQQLDVTVAPTGVTENLLGSRVFGVHLLASTYLSELVPREEEGTVTDSTPGQSEAPTPTITQSVATHVTATFVEAAAEQAPRGEAAIILDAIMNEEMAPVADEAHPARATAMATSAAATLAWPESLLRLTKGGDGSTVVWLRDYRADGEKASSLVSALVEGARAQGTRLGKIVLNGREVWTSPNNR